MCRFIFLVSSPMGDGRSGSVACTLKNHSCNNERSALASQINSLRHLAAMCCRNKLGTGPFSKESDIGHIGMLAARVLKCTCP